MSIQSFATPTCQKARLHFVNAMWLLVEKIVMFAERNWNSIKLFIPLCRQKVVNIETNIVINPKRKRYEKDCINDGCPPDCDDSSGSTG